jgi:hypothetical protein
LFLPDFEFLFVTCIFIWCFFALLAFLDSFTTEDSDYRIENAEDLRTFEVKKRKLDETEGRSLRRTRQSRKSAVDGSSSAAAGPHMRTKIVHARGPPPSRMGKGGRGPVDVEQEQEIIGNLGTAHINTWRKLCLTNLYRFHERQYTSNDKRF